MTDRTSWFPTRPVKAPAKPMTMWALFAGTLLPIAGIAALVVALSSSHAHRPTHPTSPGVSARTSRADDQRAAFEQCMRSAGAGSGSRGRFGGPSSKFREAVELCRSLASPNAPQAPVPVTPAPTAPNVA